MAESIHTARKAVRVNCELYFRSHLRSPKGNGCWAFNIGDEGGYFQTYGSFTEAKTAAQFEAVRQGVDTVTVLP